jgi:hypothetical protein
MGTTVTSRRDEYDGSVTLTGRTQGGNDVQIQIGRRFAGTEAEQRMLDLAGERMDAQAKALDAVHHQFADE